MAENQLVTLDIINYTKTAERQTNMHVLEDVKILTAQKVHV